MAFLFAGYFDLDFKTNLIFYFKIIIIHYGILIANYPGQVKNYPAFSAFDS